MLYQFLYVAQENFFLHNTRIARHDDLCFLACYNHPSHSQRAYTYGTSPIKHIHIRNGVL